ncbi:MAG: hypothetical protein KatS3mg022_1171 [Armatimonadota bacterium]|nr:MAG: hypothetical protein KatS3mg022_1171 [Armatimonadota bacterium]
MRTRIGRSSFIIFTVVATVLAVLAGCGSGRSADAPPKPLWETTRAVGPEGATIETPEQYGAKIEIAQNTFESTTQIRVQIYPPEAEMRNLPQGVVPSSHLVRIEFSAPPSEQLGGISITLPVSASRQSGDIWHFMTAYLPTAPVVIRGWHASDTAQSRSITLQPDELKLLLLGAGTAPLIKYQLITYNSTPPTLGPRGMVRWEQNQRQWQQQTPNWENKHIAILIHGIRNNISNLSDLAEKLVGYGLYDEIWGFDYNWTMHINQNGAQLADYIRSNAKDTTRIDIYGHSMGGLVARWALEKGGASRYVERLYTMGTPHLGVPIDDPGNLPGNWLVVLDNIIAFVSELNTDGVKDLLENSEFLRNLNDLNAGSRAAQNTVYIVFAGRKHEDYFATGPFSLGNYFYNYVYERLPNDGIVAVYSATPWLADPSSNQKADNIIQNRRWSKITETKGALWVQGSEQSLPLNHSEIKVPDAPITDVDELENSVKDNTNVTIR